ncbi:DUF1214 domain-containing protein [Stappia sp. F7233]|uniref:DUF1214 domain-containing protein n=1 Tax=Stappia albiluteola TaxID=2758565 RepID=A0A839AH63_9HYPH|nr:DUF1214 domain-containing protein [Stappia albiluteola]MBA5779041.1 DUF1214 domain-containing protein [Stappia albiluteola]
MIAALASRLGGAERGRRGAILRARRFDPEASWARPDRKPAILRTRKPSLTANLFLLVVAALIFGFGASYLAVETDAQFGAMQLGVWRAYPASGTPEADPYSAAVYARTGRIPLAGGEGLAFTAERDSSDELLNPACDYTIEGNTAPARLWSLVALDRAHHLVPTTAGRTVLTSQHLLRRPDGSFAITSSPFARSGNWLPTAPLASGLVFVLRLYDTPLSTGTGVAEVDMPAIIRGRCR